MKARRVLLYVQHLLGIGHLARTNHIAMALKAAGFGVTIVMGGTPVAGFPNAGIDVVQLPPVKAGGDGFASLVDTKGKAIDENFRMERTRQLLSAFQQIAPDILMIEAFPFGRRAMRFELIPLLEHAATMRQRPLIVCSIRDILQENLKPGRAEETVETIERYFDLVLVHGDPAFAGLSASFALAGAIAKEIRHTGLVAGPPPEPSPEQFDIVISAGGGAAGLPLIRAAAAMSGNMKAGLRCCLITGPNLQHPEVEALLTQPADGLKVFSFRPDFPALLAAAKLSISQAGYNTVCDILQARCRSLLIPFAAGGETEQSVRAARLAQLGLAAVLSENDVSPQTLERAASQLLAGPPPPPTTLDLEGARHTAEILRARLL